MSKRLVYEVVYDEIKRRIEQGQWKVGERIPTIEEIAAELKVGVSSVREAVRILGKQKILLVEQGRGTFVSDQLPEQADRYLAVLEHSSWLQLTETRLIIEPELAALAAERATDEQRERIVQAAELMQKKVLSRQSFLREDMKFHEEIAEASQNEILANTLRMLGDVLLDSRRQTMRIPGMDDKAAAYHLLIAMAIKHRDVEQARELMRLHISDMQRELQSGLIQ
ncbi:FadR/GntR family transcriptional regulator [Paenibacillus daejeonensis]|uniref:FadR/GntR family transcriptional regulator n=1 Tax=Paenibacillus daejeonensis TaxID=135193 RepID=UPI0003829B68|nr:FCD domain-containing protein [Paenibacillus daejeonensis]